MKTTLPLYDDVLELAAQQAKLRGVSLGKTVSDLLRQGVNASTQIEEKGACGVPFARRLPQGNLSWTINDRRIRQQTPTIP